jgi:hypothetical protein
MPPIAKPLYLDASFAAAIWNNALLTVCAGEMRLDHIEAIYSVRERIVQQHGTVMGFTIITPGLTLPNATVRAASEKLVRETADTTLGSVSAVLGDGVRMTTIRAVLSALMLAARVNKAARIFSSLEDAAEWTLTVPGVVQSGGHSPGPNLLDAARELRGHFP